MIMPTNVCPPDNDPPPCANEFAVQQQRNVMPQGKTKINWKKEYSSDKRANVYLKLVIGDKISLIKYERSEKDKKGNYIYSIPKEAIPILNKHSGQIEVVKLFIDGRGKINNFKTMYISVP